MAARAPRHHRSRRSPGSGGVPSGPPAPFPALINLTVPAGNILGWSAAPGDAGGWGLTDPGDTRRLSKPPPPPRTRWCFTLLGPDGTAVAHGCARGPHPGSATGRQSAKPRRAGRPAGRRARRPPARPQRHLHPDRQGQLQPHQRRKPLHPQPQARASGPRPYRDLPGAGLRRPGRTTTTSTTPSPIPTGSPTNATSPALQTPPSRQTSPRLEARPARTRRHELDHALRTHLHHQAHRLRDVIQAIRRAAHDLRLCPAVVGEAGNVTHDR